MPFCVHQFSSKYQAVFVTELKLPLFRKKLEVDSITIDLAAQTLAEAKQEVKLHAKRVPRHFVLLGIKSNDS